MTGCCGCCNCLLMSGHVSSNSAGHSGMDDVHHGRTSVLMMMVVVVHHGVRVTGERGSRWRRRRYLRLWLLDWRIGSDVRRLRTGTF